MSWGNRSEVRGHSGAKATHESGVASAVGASEAPPGDMIGL